VVVVLPKGLNYFVVGDNEGIYRAKQNGMPVHISPCRVALSLPADSSVLIYCVGRECTAGESSFRLDISVWSRRTLGRLFQATVLDKLRSSVLIQTNILALLEFASSQIFCLTFLNHAPEINIIMQTAWSEFVLINIQTRGCIFVQKHFFLFRCHNERILWH
jgi:hypothetical protein